MNKVLKYVVVVGVFATLALTSACTMRASTPPTVEPSATSELLFLLTPTSISDAVASQTAAVKSAIATATPEPTTAEQPTSTPLQSGGGQTQPESSSNNDNESNSEPVTIPTLTRPSTYTLQKGEWPICIARRYDLNLTSFFSANGLTMDSRPAVGTVLQVPSSGNWDSSAHGSRTLHSHASYTVQSGDTVYSIACYFGDVSPEGILAANGLSSASDVTAGMTLKIP